jgi:hypothetical protein
MQMRFSRDPLTLAILVFIGNYLVWSLIIQRVQNAEIGILHHSMDNQAPKKKHLMKSGIPKLKISAVYPL